jgi:transketolase
VLQRDEASRRAEAACDVKELARAIRLRVLEESMRAGVGHIGSALSIVDIVAALYGAVLRGHDEEHDRFILSKGHAVLALYAALVETGVLSTEQLEQYCGDGSPLGAHPEHTLDGIDFSTGSLGHGLSMAAGSALAARLQKSARRTFVLLSDAECNEGSVWEAAMFAAHHRLANLVAIVDVNGQQALGYTRDVMDLEPLASRWEAFGWSVREVNGHNPVGIATIADDLAGRGEHPHILLARTTFGAGVSFMRNRIEWHYLPLTEEQFLLAHREVRDAPMNDR